MFSKSFSDFLFRTPEIGQMFIWQAILIALLLFICYKGAKYFNPTIWSQIDPQKEKKFLITGIILSLFLWISPAIRSWLSYKIQTFMSNGSYSISWSTSFGWIYFWIYILIIFFLTKLLLSSIDTSYINSKLKFIGVFLWTLTLLSLLWVRILVSIII
jgi:hypothetical protein